MQPGLLYDGTSALPFRVHVRADDKSLILEMPDGWSDSLPKDRIAGVADEPSRVRLSRTDIEGWSLLIDKPVESTITELFARPTRYGRWIDRIGLVPALAVGGVLTATVVALGYFAPHLVAPHVPMSWERNVGGAIVGDFGDLRCRNPDGQRALEALVERVAPGSTKGPNAIKVAALDAPIFNAAALPGGYIVVFKPAITESDPDALAGIMAHEVAHVKRRHVTEALLRELGIGALVRLFAGNIGANAEQIVSLSYTRSNEAEADSDAIAMLKRAHISPKPTAELFQHLSSEQREGSGFGEEFLQSHPLSASRAQKFAAAFDSHANYTPALTREESDALFNICWRGPVKQD